MINFITICHSSYTYSSRIIISGSEYTIRKSNKGYEVYDAEYIQIAPEYKDGKWISRYVYEIWVMSGKGSMKFQGDPKFFYTTEEWRELQLEKIL